MGKIIAVAQHKGGTGKTTTCVNLAAALCDMGKTGRERSLSRKLAALKDDFDYIFIDCPPTLGILTVNALTAADSVLIPIQCEPLTLYGVKHMLQIINLIREDVNPSLKIEGVLRTMYDRRTKLSEEVSDSIKET